MLVITRRSAPDIIAYEKDEVDRLLSAAKYALADLEGIMPEFEPSGDRTHSGWKTIEDLKSAIIEMT